MASPLTETDEKVFIADIPPLNWGMNHDTSFIRATQFALNSIGENFSYTFLMGVSGAAFRFHFNPDWCPSAADVTTGFDVSSVLFKSLGYECKLHSIDDSRLEDIQALYKEIIAQINCGIPIVAINLKMCPEWGIITGYLKKQPGIICRTYYDDDDNYSMAEHAPWLSFFIGEKGEALKRGVMFRDSLNIAVQLAKTDAFDQYYSGFQALEKWMDALNRHSSKLKEGVFEEHEVNLTLVIGLLDSRRAAIEYLHLMNRNHALNSGDIIIDNYKKEAAILENLLGKVLPSFDTGQKEWTAEIIKKQVDTLSQVLELEEDTIVLIEEELKTFVY